GCVGALGSFERQRRRRIHALEVVAAAETMGLNHRATVSLDEFQDFGRLNLFSNWDSGVDYMFGTFEGLAVHLFDYTYIDRGEESASYYTQTVALLPGAESLAAFELCPRDLGIRVLGLMGIEGITFDDCEASSDAATIIERFQSHYHLSCGL